MIIEAGKLRDLIRIERPLGDTAFDSAGTASWELVAEVWAELRDMLPSRGERLAQGINVATRPSRVRIYFREDVEPSMRVVLGARVMQITTTPAELGRREGLEFMVEEYSSAGNSA